MIKSISKKFISILMILVLMFSVFTIPVQAEAITVTTAVGVAVVAGALIAAGVYCANPSYRQAINAAAMDFISRQANFLQTLKVVATATGQVFAIWGKNNWNAFTNWIKNVLGVGGVTLSGYALPVVSDLPTNIRPATPDMFSNLTKVVAGTEIYIGGSRITNAYSVNVGTFQLRLTNGYVGETFSVSANNYIGFYSSGNLTTSAVYMYVMAKYSSSGSYPVNDLSQMNMAINRYIYFGGYSNHYIYGNRGTFSFNNGTVYFNGNAVSSGWQSLNHYLIACISVGLYMGNFSFLSGGQNVPVSDHYSPDVRIQYADNSIPGLTDVQSGLIGAIGGTLPYSITDGQNVVTPVWGKWVNGQGIPIAWSGPVGTYGGPNSTTAVGTTITGTANPPITYPGDDVINPKLSRDGVAPFPTLGDDVINPADDTFITDIDDYIDPTIDKLTTPTDVSTLTQNPTDVLGPTTDVYPESDDIPNSIRDTATDTIPDVDSPAIPDVDTATDTANPINPDAPDDTADDERNTNRLKLSTLILSKFPFCIPWDIYRTVATMVQEPEIPAFDWRFSLPSFNVDETIHIDFEQFETVAYIVRWFLSACWLVTLVLLTRKVVWK